MTSIAAKIGCVPQTLHEWVKKVEVDSGKRAGVPTEMADRLKALEREVSDTRRQLHGVIDAFDSVLGARIAGAGS